jgi:hypothetical protein
MPDFHLGRDQFGVDDMLSEQDKGISGSGDMILRSLQSESKEKSDHSDSRFWTLHALTFLA